MTIKSKQARDAVVDHFFMLSAEGKAYTPARIEDLCRIFALGYLQMAVAVNSDREIVEDVRGLLAGLKEVQAVIPL